MTPYYNKNGIVIYCGDNVEVMRAIKPQVDLTVTSPPYDNLRDYNGFEWSFDDLSKELFNATKSGGVVVWVVGDATIDGSETGTSFRQALGFMECGFKLYQTLHYHKDGPPPQEKKYEKVTEYMFVFSKSTPNTINIIKDKLNRWRGTRNWGTKTIREKDGRLTTRKPTVINEYGKRTTIWRYSSNVIIKDKGHPAPFPEALARDHIISWSNEGDTVLDPFLGSGTTLKACQLLGRRGIGIELSEEYCKIAVDRLRQMSFFSLPS